MSWSADGTLAVGGSHWCTELIGAQRPIWVGLTVDTNNGAGNTVVSAWRSDAVTPPADTTTWEPLESATITGTSAIHGGTADVQIGSILGSPSFRGRIFAAEVRSTINGTIVAKGEVVTVDGRYGIRVVDVVAADRRLAGLERRS